MPSNEQDDLQYERQIFAFAEREGIAVNPLLCIIKGLPNFQRLRQGRGKKWSVGRMRKLLDGRWEQLVALSAAGQPARALREWLEKERDILAHDGIRVAVVHGPGELAKELREVPGNAMAEGSAGRGVWIMKWYD